MEEKNKNKDMKTVRNNKKIRNFTIILTVLILIVIFIIIFLQSRNHKKQSDYSNNTLTENQILNEVEKGQERQGTIQKENLENVELINNEKHNISEILQKERIWNNLLIKDIELYSKNGVTVFQANVDNQTGNDIEDKVIQILFKDKEGNVYGKVNGYLGDIKTGNTKKLYVTTSNDYTNAYDFEIEASN